MAFSARLPADAPQGARQSQAVQAQARESGDVLLDGGEGGRGEVAGLALANPFFRNEETETHTRARRQRDARSDSRDPKRPRLQRCRLAMNLRIGRRWSESQKLSL